MARSARRVARRVMRKQGGYITARQAHAAGMSKSDVEFLLDNEEWERDGRGVYRSVALPETTDAVLWRGVLACGPGSALAFESAGATWGWPECELLPAQIAVPRTASARTTGVVVHRSRDLRPRYVTHRDGLPVTAPARTLLDLAGVWPAERMARTVDHAIVQRQASTEGLRLWLDEVARQGRAGVRLIRDLLDERDEARPQESVLEGAFGRAFRRLGLEPPVAQFVVLDASGGFVARVDFAVPDLRLAIELDGYAFHGDLKAFQRDRDRRRRLTAAGWTVIEFTWADVRREPERVVREVLAHIRRLRRFQ